MDWLNFLDPEMVRDWAQGALSHQFTQMTIAFTVANWLHSGRLKKEIKAAFLSLTDSIDNVASKVTNEMSGIQTQIKVLNERVVHLEQTMEGKK